METAAIYGQFWAREVIPEFTQTGIVGICGCAKRTYTRILVSILTPLLSVSTVSHRTITLPAFSTHPPVGPGVEPRVAASSWRGSGR